MAIIIDYGFADGLAHNPDGGLAATVKDCRHERVEVTQPDWGTLRHSLVFGTESLLQLPAVDRLAGLPTFTVEVVARPSRGGTRMNLVEGQTTPFALFLEGAPAGGYVPVASVHLAGGAGWRSVRGAEALPSDRWTHVGMSWTADALVLFVGQRVVARLPLVGRTLQPVGMAPIHVGKWVDGARFAYHGGLAGLRIHDGVPAHLGSLVATAERQGVGEIDAKHLELGGTGGFLGAPTGAEHTVAGGRRRSYTGGTICWHPSTGAWEVHGAILTRYEAAGGPAGFLGFPRTDEFAGARPGSRVSMFSGGGIWWSATTGAREVHGEIYRKYLTLGAESGFLALPITDERAEPGGRSSSFQGGAIYWSPASSAHEVHGAILERFRSLGGPGGFVGYPTTDETDVRDAAGRPTGGKLSRFTGATVYWSAATGAWEVHGAIRDFYERRGGPRSDVGYLLSNETGVPGTAHRYNDTQHGVLVYHASSGVRFFGELELVLGMVRSGPINDGIGDSSAELITYTSLSVDGHARETRVRRPSGHAGTSFDLAAAGAQYRVAPVRGRTRIDFTVRVDDWDRVSADDYLGSFRRVLDITTLWGTAGATRGTHTRQPMSEKGADAPRLDSVTLDYSVAVLRPSGLDPTKHFREQYWWSFDNFTTPKLSQQQYADTFRDVGHRTNVWETITHPWDSLFYLAYEGIAAGGNCVGMSIEAAYSRAGCSRFTMPIHGYPGRTAAPGGPHDPNLALAINEKQGYQIGDDHVRWVLWKLATLDAIRPLAVYANVKRALACGDWPVLSMFSLRSLSGHTVLPYECRDGAPGAPHRILVADPNVPWADATGDATFVQVNRDDTFSFSADGLSYRSDRIAGVLPATLMLETPLSVVSSQPRTPFWEFAAFVAAFGGLLVLAGDGETTQLTADGVPLYRDQPVARSVPPGGARGWLPLPSFDRSAPRELFVQSGATTDRLDIAVRGTRTGRYRQYVRTSTTAVRIEGPTSAGGADTVRIRTDGGRRPELEFDTTDPQKTCTIGVAPVPRVASRPVVGLGAHAEVPVGRAGTALVRGMPGGAGLVIRPVGPAAPLTVTLERLQAGRLERASLTARPSTVGETLQIRPSDPASPLGEAVIEHLTSPAGGLRRREVVEPRRLP